MINIQYYQEFDESYFGARRIWGKRGRGAAGKNPVFDLLKRDGKAQGYWLLKMFKSLSKLFILNDI